MGIRRRILNKLKILGGDDVRPATRYSTATPTEAPRKAAPPPPPPKTLSPEEAKAQIEADIAAHKLLVFMKGTPAAPMCGFSAAVVDMFNQLGVPYETRNVLADPALRQGIKDITDWPTIPQVFVGHEFIGGCDITREMFESGELKTAVTAALEA
jgi:monothiol glutaredoxin